MASEWAYALAQGGAAAAGMASKQLGDQMREERDTAEEKRKSEIRIAEATKIAEMNDQLREKAELRRRQRDATMGKEIDAKAKGMLSEEDAAKINAGMGSQIDPSNPESKASLDAIRANPEAAKRYGLLEDTELDQTRRRAEAARGLGYTDAAKELDTHRTNLRREKTEAERTKAMDKRTDLMDEIAEKRDKRQQELNERMLKAAEARDKAQSAREERQALSIALKDVQENIKALEKDKETLAKDLSVDEKAKAEARKKIDALIQRERAAGEEYRKRLTSKGDDSPPSGAPKAEGAPRPAPKVGDIVNGMRFNGGNPNAKESWTPVEGQKPAAGAGSKAGMVQEPPKRRFGAPKTDEELRAAGKENADKPVSGPSKEEGSAAARARLDELLSGRKMAEISRVEASRIAGDAALWKLLSAEERRIINGKRG